MFFLTVSPSSSKACSVISIHSMSGDMPCLAVMVVSILIKDSERKWRAEMLTETRGIFNPLSTQIRICLQVSSRTNSPIWLISDDCSAILINSNGGISPRSGCRQRSKTSMPVNWFFSFSTCGWNNTKNWLSVKAWRIPFSISNHWCAIKLRLLV